jgi:ABC-type lipoprotein release transport system permease subunit
MTARLSLPADRYSTPERRIEFYKQLRERLAALPNTSSVVFATVLPLVVVVLALIATAASLAPARRALRLDPVLTLRHE